MITEDAFLLLKKTPPFSLLGEAVLKNIANEAFLEFHPKGQTILHQNGPAAEHLHIVQSGAVKVFVRTNEGEEVLVDYRTSGDFFGLLSFACGDISRDTVAAVEDTSCYLIKKDTVLGLLKTNAGFAEFCFRSRLKRLMDMTYREIRDRTLLYGGGDKLLFTNVLADLATKRVITAPEDITIREAAAVMANHGISSLVLLDPQGFPSGLVTDRDLRNKVVAKGRDTGGRVGDIMSVTIIKSEARDYCFEALLKMIRYNIHHLLVVDKGELSGIITSHDLMMLQGTSPLSVAREIESQDTIDGLEPAARKISKVITLLIREGAKASHITRIITEINDRLLKRILEITESRMGPPPAGYCWIVFGSEGRREQTFKTDQDNAIIYEDAGAAGDDAAAYFSEFAVRMRDALARCGFPPCSADYMASNPKWRQPLGAWKKYFSSWIHSPTPEAVLRSLIFFDFRPVHGDALLAEKLRAFLTHEIKGNNLFLANMAGAVLRNRPPLGLIGGIRTEKKGPQKGTFNIKINGLCPVIDIARLYALEAGVYQTATLARFTELRDRPGPAAASIHELEQAFEFLMSLRLRHQFRQMGEGTDPDNFINPHDLSVMEQRQLKEAFRLILFVQEATKQKYSAWAEM
jgi:CBS domain-containing protein